MRTRRLLAALVGSTMALTLAGAAFAVDFADGPQGDQLPISAESFGYASAEDCALDPVQPGTGEDVWHFVNNQTTATSGTLTATFTNTGETITPNGEPLESANLHYWVTVQSGDTLESASDDATDGSLRVSHICAGPEPTPTPTLPPTNTLDQTPTSPAGTSLYLLFGLILAVAGGLVAYAMRPRRSMR